MASATYIRKRREKAQERSRKGVEARERKRLERTSDAECVGTVVFDGPMFGGRHEMRCLAAEWMRSEAYMLANDALAAEGGGK